MFKESLVPGSLFSLPATLSLMIAKRAALSALLYERKSYTSPTPISCLFGGRSSKCWIRLTERAGDMALMNLSAGTGCNYTIFDHPD